MLPWLVLPLLALLVLAPAPAVAQEADGGETAASDPTTLEALSQRLEATRQELSAAQAERDEAAPGPIREALDKRVERLSAIASTLGQAVEQRRLLDAKPEPLPAPAPDSASIATLIESFEELERNRRRSEDLAEAAEAADDNLEAARDALGEAERARREARDDVEAAPSPEATRRHEQARLASRAAGEQLHLRELEREAGRLARQRAEARSRELEQQVEALTAAIRAEPGAGALRDAGLDTREGELLRRREAAATELASAETRLAAATARLESGDDRSSEAVDRVEALRAVRDATAQELGVLDGELARVSQQRVLQERWLSAIRDTADPEERRAWADESEAAAREAERQAIQQQGRISEIEGRLEGIQDRLAAPDQSATQVALLEQRSTALTDLAATVRQDVAGLERQARVQQHFLEALEAGSTGTPLLARLRAAGGAAGELWRYEITTVDDEAITVGNALLAVVLLALGFAVARRASASIRRLIDARLELEPGVAGAVQTAVFYALLIAFGLVALRTVNFPLTAFTVAGGALAIGIGFGSQNVMNNFISGLILMLERPVRSHDLVEVEGTHGTIESIGARSTRIRATDGRAIIVPNSFFLENNVVNWTLSDDLIRGKVTVGIAYGSPTRKAGDLLLQVLDENRQILEQPPPIILFNEFGDNSLNFDAYFWVRARGPMQVYKVASEVRFQIDDLFRQHDIVIAFPQRDVHLDSSSPIQIEMVPDRDDG